MMRKITLLIGLFFGLQMQAQVGIGTTTPDLSSSLDISSNNTGLLIPRVALTATTIAAPVTAPIASLLVYNTASVADVVPGFYYWDGSVWRKLTSVIPGNSNVTTTTSGVTITNGTGQVIGGSNMNIDVATNTSTSNGLVLSGAGQNTKVWGTDALGNPSWKTPTSIVNVQNGLNLNTTAPNASITNPYLELGGNLIRNSTITQGAFNMNYDLTGAGNFRINHVNTLATTASTYPFGISRAGITEYTIGSDANYIYNQSWNAKPLVLNSQGNNSIINPNTGNVGVGLFTPLNKFDLSGNTRSGTHATGLPFYATGNVLLDSSGFEFRHSNGTQGIGLGYNTIYATGSNAAQDLGLASRSTGNLNFSTNAFQRMIILGSNGNVGLGLTNPNYNLEINGTLGYGNGTPGVYKSRTETRNDAGQIATQSGFFETNTPVNFPAGASSWWHLIDTRHSNNANNYALQIAGSFFDQDLWFRKTNSIGTQAWSKLLTSTSGWQTTGNLGTNAATNFVGTIDAIDFVTRTSNIERMRVTAGGNVGIGTTLPLYRLDNVGFGGSNIDLRTTGRIWTNSPSGGMWLSDLQDSFMGNISTTQFGFWSSTVGWNALNINKTSGFVGIGTTTPVARLHVVSDGDNIPVIYGVNTNTSAGTTSYGVRGESASTGLGSAGVSGVSTNSSQNEIGVLGDYSLWGASLFGLAWASSYADMPSSRDFGVFATCNFSTGTGVYSRDMSNSAASYAFYGTGKFSVTGAKAASVPTTKGNQLLYCTESPEIWFEDLGGGKLTNGSTHIALDAMFLETVFIDAEHTTRIFLQEEGESNGLIVIKDADGKGFTVKEKNNGTSNIDFSYRIMAKRRFYQDQRFGVDSNQPFGNNLINAKDSPLITSDPEVMKQFVEEQTKLKESASKK